LVLVTALAGGLGAGARYVIDTLVKRRTASRTPWGTIVINVSGSLVLGLLTGLAATLSAGPVVSVIVGTGFLGGYTTFSTASFETVQLLRERAWGPAIIAGPVALVATVLAAAAGYGIAAL